MSRFSHKKNHIPINDDNFNLNFSTSKNILETYEKKFSKESYKVKDLLKVVSWMAGTQSTKTWRDLKTNTSSPKKIATKMCKTATKLQQCWGVNPPLRLQCDGKSHEQYITCHPAGRSVNLDCFWTYQSNLVPKDGSVVYKFSNAKWVLTKNTVWNLWISVKVSSKKTEFTELTGPQKLKPFTSQQ